MVCLQVTDPHHCYLSYKNMLEKNLFADDTNLFYCDSNLNELIRWTNTEMDKLLVWFAVNRLSINITKTNCMVFGNRKLNTIIFIKINKEALDIVEVTKCLGILIDDKLMWKIHVSLVKSKLSKCCAIMFRDSAMIDRCGLRVLYHSLFFALYYVLR